MKVGRVGLIVIAVILGGLISATSGAAAGVGDLAPVFQMETTDGGIFRLSDYRGRKPVYLVFWNTWCSYCIEKVARLIKLQEQLGNRIEIIAINTGREDSKDTIKQFRERYSVNYRLALDRGENVTDRYGVGGVPTEFIVDVNGVIRYRDGVPKHLAAHIPDWFLPYTGSPAPGTCSK